MLPLFDFVLELVSEDVLLASAAYFNFICMLLVALATLYALR